MTKFVSDFEDFFDPITGERHLKYKYILMGNRANISYESPVLKDLWIDLVAFEENISQIPFIIQHPNPFVPNAQALDQLESGILRQDGGVISIQSTLPPDLLALQENYVFVGNSDNVATAVPTVLLQNLPSFLSADITSNFGFTNLYTGGINLSAYNPVCAPSTTMRVNTCNLPNLSRGKIWIGTYRPLPPNISILPVPPYITWDGYPSYDTLNWDPLALLDNSQCVPVEVGLSTGMIFMGSPAGLLQETGLDLGEIFTGNADGQMVPLELPAGQMFIGTVDGIDVTDVVRGQIFIGTDEGIQTLYVPFSNIIVGNDPVTNNGIGLLQIGPSQMMVGTGDGPQALTLEVNQIPMGTADGIQSTGLAYKNIFMGDISDNIQVVGLAAGLMFIGDYGDTGQIETTGLNEGSLFTGNTSNQIVQLAIGINNIPFCDSSGAIISQGLPAGFIFMGKSDDSGEIQQVGLAQGSLFVGNDLDEIVVLTLEVNQIPFCNDASNIISQGLDAYQIFTGSPADNGEIIITTVLNIANLPTLPVGEVWLGDEDGRPSPIGLAQGSTFVGNSLGQIDSLYLPPGTLMIANDVGDLVATNALSGQILSGNPDNSGGFLIIDPPFADNNATYVIRLADDGLPNAQVLSDLSNGIANIVDGYIGTFSITAGTGITITNGNSVAGNPVIKISDTTVVAGTYEFVSGTWNAQGQATELVDNSDVIADLQNATYVLRNSDVSLPNAQILSSLTNGIATVNDGLVGTVSIVGGTGITVTNGDGILGNPVVNIADTGVTAGVYAYATINVNAQGQILLAADNSTAIDTINARLDTDEGDILTLQGQVGLLEGTVSGLSADVLAIDATLYDPILGIATIVVPGLVISVAGLGTEVAALNTTVNFPATGLVDRMNFLTSSLIAGTIAAEFIVKTANVVVPNAQALDVLGGGILQADAFGTISIATGVGSVTSVGISSDYLLISGSPVTSSGTIDVELPPTGVTPGTYINPNYLEVNEFGCILSVVDGTGEGEWQVVEGDTNLVAGQGYFADSSSGIITFTLPASAVVGDTFKVRGMGLGGWQVAQNSGQLIVVAGQATTAGTGGSLQSIAWSAGIDITCVVDNIAFIGNVVSDSVNVS